MSILTFILTALLLQAPDVITFESLSHDFGPQPNNVERLTHEFVFTNTSSSPVTISYAVATCTCTSLTWTKGPVQPGAKGVVKAVYARELFVKSFEKFISVFVEGQSKPYVLRIAGTLYDTSDILSSEFPVVRGALGLKDSPLPAGKRLAGTYINVSFWAANLSPEPIAVEFTNLSDSLEISPAVQSIKPVGRARFFFSLPVSPDTWGPQFFYATPVVDGIAQEPVSFSVIAIDDFSSLSAEERAAAPYPVLRSSTCSFGTVRSGQPAKASFEISNDSDQPLIIRAVYSETDGISFDAPSAVGPRKSATLVARIAPSALSKGSNVLRVQVQTNSPYMQILDIDIVGKVE